MTVQVITTVVTPAVSTALVDLALVKAELALTATTDDVLLTAWIARASLAAAQYCNRTLVAETVRDDIWFERDPYPWQVPGGSSPLQLARWPILPTPPVAVTLDGTALTVDDDYAIDVARGQLIRLDIAGRPCSWASVPVSISYAAGYSPIPADIQDAVIRMVKSRWFARLRDPMLRREEIPGVYSAEWWVSTGNTGNLSPDVADLLDNYRIPVVA